MKIFEFSQQGDEIVNNAGNEVGTGYYDPAADTLNARKLTDTRKAVLTLADLNRLKKMRALKKLEKHKRQDLLGIMYAAPEAPPGGGMGF